MSVWRVVRLAALGLPALCPTAGAQVAPTAAAASASSPAVAARVRFAPEKDYGPFVYVEANGQVAGLSVDILQRVAQRAGLALITLPARPLNEILLEAKAGRVDIISSLRPTPQRAEFLNFTSAYVSVPAVLVVRVGQEQARLATLAGRPVAVGKGYAVEGEMRRRYPTVQWQAVDDDVLALQGVADGQHSAAVVDVASLVFIQRRQRLPALKVAEQVGFEYALSFAVRKDAPQLLATLEEGIRGLPASERDALVLRWLQPTEAPLPGRSPKATRLALALLAATALLLVWRWLRKRAAARGGP